MPRTETSPPPATSVLNRVFVDFENVPSVDLSLIGEQPVSVTLLIGEKQRRLELGLVRQIHEHAAKLTLVEVGASGRNALDLVLAWHLGKTAERHPSDRYFVVSRDKDFEPLLGHLRAQGLRVQRVDGFAALPFLSPARPRPEARRAAANATEADDRAGPGAAAADGRIAKLIDRLQHKTNARPVRRRTLLSHINGFFGNQLAESELAAVVQLLERRRIVAVDAAGHVTYPENSATTDTPPPAPAPRPRRARRSRNAERSAGGAP